MNLTDLGAKGDGVADDGAALRASGIFFLLSGGKTVVG